MSGLQRLTPLGDVQITGLSAAKGIGPVPAAAKAALIQAEAATVRWKADGVAPTAALGTRLIVDDDFLFVGDLNKIQFIELSASAVLNISFYTW